MSDPTRPPAVPPVLRLAETIVAGRWRATGEELYREVARLTEAGPGCELLVVGCGEGILTEWLATRTGATVNGVDPDRTRIEAAEERARRATAPIAVSYEVSPLDDLPHETAVFDAVIAEPALAAAADAQRAVRELVRVLKPMGVVVLLQPTWSSSTPAETRELAAERLGWRPRLVVAWKQILREAGIVEIQVQDWSDGAPGQPAGRAAAAPNLSWSQKVHIVGRAWRRWGWRPGGLRAARGAVERERQLLRELTRERGLGFHLIKGVKWPHARGAGEAA